MALVGRSYVDIDRDLGRVTGVRQYGPIRIARTLPLAGIRQVRTTVDDRDDVTVYNVELVGTDPKEAIVVGFSRKRAQCQAFAKELRRALKIPFMGPSDAVPDVD